LITERSPCKNLMTINQMGFLYEDSSGYQYCSSIWDFYMRIHQLSIRWIFIWGFLDYQYCSLIWDCYMRIPQLSIRWDFYMRILRTINIAHLYDVESYWLTKEWIATAVYLKWMRNSAHYIEIFLIHLSTDLHLLIHRDSSWDRDLRFVTKIFSSDQVIFVFRCHFDLISSKSHIHLRIHWSLDDLENQ
jgi:hypothetical protein